MVYKSTLKSLPSIEGLLKLSQSLAMLDAVVSPDWEYRYYSFNSRWNKGEMMASMRNGSGDEYFILFNSEGAIIKGFAHESQMSPYAGDEEKVWDGVLDFVPDEFHSFLNEPAFSLNETTFCIWRRYKDTSWQVGNINYPKGKDPDGSKELLSMLDGKPSSYKEFAEEYYEMKIPLRVIEHIYEHEALTDEIIKTLNPETSKQKLRKEIEEIGYPND